MESILVSSTVFAVVFGGALAGMGLRQALPQNQLGAEVKDVIRLATGLLVTMTALVLGMLVSTANSSYQDRKNELAEMGSNFVLVDGLLASYGPDAQAIREELRGLAETGLERVWQPTHPSCSSDLRTTANPFMTTCGTWRPRMTPRSRLRPPLFLRPLTYGNTYWLMFIGVEQSSLSFPLLLVVVSWLTFIFISFGLFAPGHQSSIRDPGRLRTRRFRCGVHHHGDVYAFQRS